MTLFLALSLDLTTSDFDPGSGNDIVEGELPTVDDLSDEPADELLFLDFGLEDPDGTDVLKGDSGAPAVAEEWDPADLEAGGEGDDLLTSAMDQAPAAVAVLGWLAPVGVAEAGAAQDAPTIADEHLQDVDLELLLLL